MLLVCFVYWNDEIIVVVKIITNIPSPLQIPPSKPRSLYGAALQSRRAEQFPDPPYPLRPDLQTLQSAYHSAHGKLHHQLPLPRGHRIRQPLVQGLLLDTRGGHQTSALHDPHSHQLLVDQSSVQRKQEKSSPSKLQHVSFSLRETGQKADQIRQANRPHDENAPRCFISVSDYGNSARGPRTLERYFGAILFRELL